MFSPYFRVGTVRFLMICLMFLIALAATPKTLAQNSPDTLLGQSFFDDFDTLVRPRWTLSNGWVNGAWQNCEWSDRAVRLEDGILSLQFLRAQSNKRKYICAEIQSRKFYGYGVYEARLKTGTGSGLNAAFFTYTGEPHENPHHEIDFEVLTKDTGSVSVNTYVDGSPTNGKAVKLATRTDAAFKTYSFIWQESGIRWFVDGRQIHETKSGTPVPKNPQKIYASFWGSDTFVDWMGPFNPPTAAIEMQVDWIAFTQLGQPCQFPASVLCAAN